MYKDYFGFNENPFSIAPDPRYLFLSVMHQDALAHLNYGAVSNGCITLLTGDVGTGKTTLCRRFLEQLDDSIDIALLINPTFSADELLVSICEEFRVSGLPENATTKQLIDRLNEYLLKAHSTNRQPVLIIDEAQNLAPSVLETLRLLTNLETDRHKLLKIMLLGQSELNGIMSRPDLTQINQRITSRYHLRSLNFAELKEYVAHRITRAGCARPGIFTDSALKTIFLASRGIPRLVNSICDRSLLGAYAEGAPSVSRKIAGKAAAEILGHVSPETRRSSTVKKVTISLVLLVAAVLIGLLAGNTSWNPVSRIPRIIQPNGEQTESVQAVPQGDNSQQVSATEKTP